MYYPHIKLKEMECPCCGKALVNEDLMMKLNVARSIAGIPFVIMSGYRCPKHNREIGALATSSHVFGLAADIAAPFPEQRYKIIRALIMVGFNRIGINPHRGFIHADLDRNKPQEIIWIYEE